MTIKTTLSAATLALALSFGTAFAQGAAPAKPAATTKAAPAKAAAAKAAPAKTAKKAAAPAKPRSSASLQCSKDANAKGLKGSARKKFRASCMRAAKKAAKKAKPTG